jgi:hypothetical protein
MRLTHRKAGASTKAEMSCDPEDGRNRFLVNIKNCQTISHHVLLHNLQQILLLQILIL